MRLWETEKFMLNLKTGELMRALSTMYIQGENFEHAQLRLLESKMDWLRLTGAWLLEGDLTNPTEEQSDSKPRDDNEFNRFDFSSDEEDDEDFFKLFNSTEEEGEKDKEFKVYNEKDWGDFKRNETLFLRSLDVDQILDWLTTLKKEQVDTVLKSCVDYELLDRAKVVEGYLKYRYGKKN